MKKVLLVDGFSLFFRSFYATAKYMGDGEWDVIKTSNGQATNAVRVFCDLIIKIVEQKEPDYMMVVFDSPKKSWRHDHSFYKDNRKKQPTVLIEQIPLVKEFLDHYGVPRIEVEGLEADDVIGIIAKQESKNKFIEIITGDYDFLQLVEPNIHITITKRGLSETKTYDPQAVQEEYSGLMPAQLIDVKGLMGDVSDNIPGIKGVGKKTAVKLINRFQNLENVIRNVDNLTGTLKDKIFNGQEDAILSKKLGTIIINQDIGVHINDLLINKYVESDLKAWLMELELYSIMNKIGV